jgi:hypothetical protein
VSGAAIPIRNTDTNHPEKEIVSKTMLQGSTLDSSSAKAFKLLITKSNFLFNGGIGTMIVLPGFLRLNSYGHWVHDMSQTGD